MQAARVLTHTVIMCAYFHVLRHDIEKVKLASVLPKMLQSNRIGFRTQLASSETLSRITAFIRLDRPEISIARSKILLFIQDHERWRRSIGFDFTFNDGKIMAFRTSDRALEFVQRFNSMYCAAGGGYVYKSDAMPPNMSQFLAWRQTMSQVSELERRSAWLVLSRSALGSGAPSHFFQFRDMIVRFLYVLFESVHWNDPNHIKSLTHSSANKNQRFLNIIKQVRSSGTSTASQSRSV